MHASCQGDPSVIRINIPIILESVTMIEAAIVFSAIACATLRSIIRCTTCCRNCCRRYRVVIESRIVGFGCIPLGVIGIAGGVINAR